MCKGFRIMLLDDCTRFTWYYPLHKNSDFFSCLLKFQKMIETQVLSKIKIFPSDGGGEFIGTDFVHHLENCRIIYQLSCVGTLEQDGVVERKHQHIENKFNDVFSCKSCLLSTGGCSFHNCDSHRCLLLFYKIKAIAELYNKELRYSFLKIFGCRSSL